MTPSRDEEVDEANNISYPSPEDNAMDAGPFYHTRNGADQQEQSDIPDTGVKVDDVQPVEQEHNHDHEHDHTHDLEHDDGLPPQDPENSHPHVSRPANLEELQLAAQLGHGLAGTAIMSATDPNMNVDDPNLRNIMAHTEAEQQEESPYVPDDTVPDAMVQHPMHVPVAPPLAAQYAMGNDGIPPRKRSKVSRACDECRRKKIKCDAQSDSGDTPCSSCARSSIRCLFSRVPQKRGPSKGYIKELADRIHSIENKLESEGGLNQDEIDRLFAPDRPRTYNGTGDDSRKRPFSSISTGEFNTPASARQAPWGSEQRQLQTPSDGLATGSYSNSALAPQPSAVKADDTPTKQPTAPMDEPVEEVEETQDLDEDVLNELLSTVQTVYPILPTSKSRMEALLEQCPAPVKSAFSITLSAVLQSSPTDVKIASSLLHEWENMDVLHSRAADIVHMQTLLLLIIEADWRASSTLPFLLARAVALANTMKLWKSHITDAPLEADSDDQLCLRIWWSLVLMDRWYAAGTGKPAQIPDSSAVAPAGLEGSVGEACFYLIRLSKLLNRISYVISTLQPGSATADPPMAAILTDYIENYREDLPSHIDSGSYPLVHLAYWHCRLLVTLLTPGATPAESFWPTKELTNLLLANPQIKTPLINHFVSLATMSLAKLSKTDSSRDSAMQLLKDVLDKPQDWHWDSVRDKITDLMRPVSSAEATASRGLQHLADLATAHEGIEGGDEAAAGMSLVSGYLETS